MSSGDNLEKENIDQFKSDLKVFLGDLYDERQPWDIDVFENYGRGLVATRDIAVNEVIFYDRPMLCGPRVNNYEIKFCVVCYTVMKEVPICANGCCLPVCNNCSTSPDSKHTKECTLIQRWKPKSTTFSLHLFYSLTSIRGLGLNETERRVLAQMEGHPPLKENKTEIQRLLVENHLENLIEDSEEAKYLHRVVSVLNTNAFESLRLVKDEDNNDYEISLRGLFILGALMNHRCLPNVRYVFQDDMVMKCSASKPIKKGEQIFNNYSKILWGTQHRIIHLYMSKSFLCSCERCKDPTERGTYLAALKCIRASCPEGRLLPLNPLKVTSVWQCDKCGLKMDNKKVTNIHEIAGKLILAKAVKKGSDFMVKYINDTVPTMLLPTNQFTIELKLTAIKTIQKGCPIEEQMEKEKYCVEVLDVLEKLQYGECFIKAILCYELFKARLDIFEEQGEIEKLYATENIELLKTTKAISGGSASEPSDLNQLLKTYSS